MAHKAAVVWLPPTDLLPHPGNWKRHPAAQIDCLADSISRFGWLKTVLYNERTGHILNGHARVEAAITECVDEVPVCVIDVAPEEEREILLSFDRIGQMRERDDLALAALLEQIQAESCALPPCATDALLEEVLAAAAGELQTPPAGWSGQDPESTPPPPPPVAEGDYRPIKLVFTHEEMEEVKERAAAMSDAYGTEGIAQTILAAIKDATERRLGW